MTQTTQDELEKLVSMLLKAAQAEAMEMSADQRIGEDDAAKLLALKKDTLRRARQEGRGPKFSYAGVGKARVSYRLERLAEWLQSRDVG